MQPAACCAVCADCEHSKLEMIYKLEKKKGDLFELRYVLVWASTRQGQVRGGGRHRRRTYGLDPCILAVNLEVRGATQLSPHNCAAPLESVPLSWLLPVLMVGRAAPTPRMKHT